MLVISQPNISTLSILDANTSNVISSSRDLKIGKNKLDVINKNEDEYEINQNINNTIIISGEDDKSTLNSHGIQSNLKTRKGNIKSIVSSLCVYDEYVVCGHINGYICLWSISDGQLVSEFMGHIKKIGVIKCIDDMIISGSDDALIHIFNLPSIFQNNTQPWTTFSNHTLPIQDLYIGNSGILSRLYSASLDGTVCIFSIYSKRLLYRISCLSYCNCITLDHLEHFLFIGGGDSKIYCTDLDLTAIKLTNSLSKVTRDDDSLLNRNRKRRKLNNNNIESTESRGQALSSLIETNFNSSLNSSKENDDNNDIENNSIFEGHKGIITCLRTTNDGLNLYSSSNDGTIRIWDILTRTCIKEITMAKSSPISYFLLISYSSDNLYNSNQSLQRESDNQLIAFKKYTQTTQQMGSYHFEKNKNKGRDDNILENENDLNIGGYTMINLNGELDIDIKI